MRSNTKIILAIACLVLASLSCQAVMGGGGNNTPVIPTIPPIDTSVPTEVFPTETQSNSGDVLLSDDFSSSQWGTGTDTDSSIEYANETLQMIVFTKNYIVWSTPNDQAYQNVHMEVTVLNNNTDSTSAFGMICNQQATANTSFYYFVIKPAGQYAIIKSTAGQKDVFLTNNNAWASSNLISVNASSYRLGTDCGNGTLTLYVDGQQVDSVSDSSYTSGGIGLLTWSGEKATTTNVSFDDFVMTNLP